MSNLSEKESYGRCETCRNYCRTSTCCECNEGSKYEYESTEYHDARVIVLGMERKAAPIPYDNDYANNEDEHIWYKVTSAKELDALSTLYGDDLPEQNYKLPDYICVQGDYEKCDIKYLDPYTITEEASEEIFYRFTSLTEATNCFNELRKSLIDEKIVVLKDLEEGCADAVIISSFASGKEIETAINDAKANNDEWQFEDLVAALPNHCELITKWSGDIEEIYY